MKYIVIVGTVMSGIGKGITASSIGVVLQSYGVKVTAIKIDPYLNLDSGTMSPFEHGECYVLADGGETDLDLGNYERFCGLKLTKDHNITTGKIYHKVIMDERSGKFLGKTVQVVPHVTDQIQQWIERVSQIPVSDGEEPEVCLIELGGTIGDMESNCYAEALRQLSFNLGKENLFFVNVCYCPIIEATNEIKTKPAQNGLMNIRSKGINPDLLIVRCQKILDPQTHNKLKNISRIPIIINHNVENIYQVPLLFEEYKLFATINKSLKLRKTPELSVPFRQRWVNQWNIARSPDLIPIKIAVVGKYVGMVDSYLSLTHAIRDAAYYNHQKPDITFLDSDELLDSSNLLDGFDRIIIPGGFGIRGIEGMILAAQFARTNGIPCLGICLGFQIMAIEYARHLGISDASSSEFNPDTKNPVITIINRDQKNLGGTMHLGEQKVILEKGSKIHQIYGKELIGERHRHRYEFNPKYIDSFLSNELAFTGTNGDRIEVMEHLNDQFYVGVQYHPEYLTRPGSPHPLFVEWIK